ncbi:Protein NirH [Magnetospirillum sp. LM-5]|uniref:siroheme decarboxylase subunit beta n=1 Tax=Magnetospirillum sp. LM-5 TaxID=2681466 RepID=UPI00138626E0|nr:Lrp/AsnC family transcriptional regulator [Magnetospirillum sp. LM-5]CAA7611382.1 Protein NirH [Magnetospirillum sp. LM-5]
MRQLDDLDRRIIVATQDGLPLVPEPWRHVAGELGVEAEDLMDRVRAMQEDGIIRRIGLVPNHYALGYRHNGMSVWDVADEDVEAAGAAMTALGFVSHCYQRPRCPPAWPYNLFAMIHARDAATADSLVQRLAEALGPMSRGHLVLYSTRILKKTGLRLGA